MKGNVTVFETFGKVRWVIMLGLVLMLALSNLGTAFAQGSTPPDVEQIAETASDTATSLNVLWVLIAGALVFFMQGGFALVETGFTRNKNVVHTMMMNTMVFCIGALGYWLVGFAFQFGGVNYTYPAINGHPEWNFSPSLVPGLDSGDYAWWPAREMQAQAVARVARLLSERWGIAAVTLYELTCKSGMPRPLRDFYADLFSLATVHPVTREAAEIRLFTDRFARYFLGGLPAAIARAACIPPFGRTVTAIVELLAPGAASRSTSTGSALPCP